MQGTYWKEWNMRLFDPNEFPEGTKGRQGKITIGGLPGEGPEVTVTGLRNDYAHSGRMALQWSQKWGGPGDVELTQEWLESHGLTR